MTFASLIVSFLTAWKTQNLTNELIKAEEQMIKNGIVAVGDICNTTDTLFQKQKGNLLYYNFIETFQINKKKIKEHKLKSCFHWKETWNNIEI